MRFECSIRLTRAFPGRINYCYSNTDVTRIAVQSREDCNLTRTVFNEKIIIFKLCVTVYKIGIIIIIL